jgi:predicted signal transduction protein with EAL and GGDEF domain
MGAFPQWFPLIYVTAFLFLRRKMAIHFSIVIYTSIAIPFLISLFVNRADFSDKMQFPIILSMLEAHPIYIALLLGVSTLQEAFLRATVYAEAMSIAATIDHLTQLPNRRSLTEKLQQQLNQFQSGQTEHSFAVILLDVDRAMICERVACGDTIVSASFGISLATPSDTLETLVQRADQALYAAKEKGRNRVEVAVS